MESLALEDVGWFEIFPELSRAPETLRRDDSICGRPSSSPVYLSMLEMPGGNAALVPTAGLRARDGGAVSCDC
jgi:hypothetical protein